MKRIYIFPRYSGNENSDWYQNLKQTIEVGEEKIEVIPLSFPNWDKPSIDEFKNFIGKIIPEDAINQNTYLIAHSIGCKAALLFLDELHTKNNTLKIGGLMCVAGWWKIDNPWPLLNPWINMTLDYAGIRSTCNNNILCLLSDNDPFTSDHTSNKNEWENLLNSQVRIVPNAKHFNQDDGFVDILKSLEWLIR